MGGDEIAEIVGKLLLRKIVNLLTKVLAQSSDGAGIGVGVDGIGLQHLELEVLKMGLVLPVKVRGWRDRWCCHAVSAKL